eukprot:TRINITY_DN3947_c0_g1_i1.p1 TRINITY_DN3947_c0_g1~~TRINITY_DN3947_c0_g1_i1.p1  ORF type:complete len:118 (-),score=12.01 TRINITY_DN3947_c0_g1_i1:210-524(-)
MYGGGRLRPKLKEAIMFSSLDDESDKVKSTCRGAGGGFIALRSGDVLIICADTTFGYRFFNLLASFFPAIFLFPPFWHLTRSSSVSSISTTSSSNENGKTLDCW